VSMYEHVFGRPIPEGYREIETCLGCGTPTDDPRDCGCPAGTGAHLVHADGSKLTADEKLSLYKRTALGEHLE
jgi:hypothetical protein